MNEGDEMVDICKCKSIQFLSAKQMVCQGNHHKTQALDQIRFSEAIYRPYVQRGTFSVVE